MRKRLNVRDYQYFIIAGTTRAGTTSLFSYFKKHPQVCAANIKETRFFLDAEYPLPSKYRFEDNLDKYDEFFGHCSDRKFRMEATPDYLYSPATPLKIKKSLPKVKLIFVLREPVSRLISWYKFAKQMGFLTSSITFEAYVQDQLRGLENGMPRPQHMRALEQGRYSYYLKPYFDLFSPEQICVIWFEDLKDQTLQIAEQICAFLVIDPAFFETFDFKLYNQARTMRNSSIHRAYMETRRRLRYNVNRLTIIRKFLHSIRLAIDPIYMRFNALPSEEFMIPDKIKIFLYDYYKHESDLLADFLGNSVPWYSTGNID